MMAFHLYDLDTSRIMIYFPPLFLYLFTGVRGGGVLYLLIWGDPQQDQCSGNLLTVGTATNYKLMGLIL